MIQKVVAEVELIIPSKANVHTKVWITRKIITMRIKMVGEEEVEEEGVADDIQIWRREELKEKK